jgi:membrane protein YdbS with pleckstrin-like domain
MNQASHEPDRTSFTRSCYDARTMELRQSLKAVKAAYLGCLLMELVLGGLWWYFQPDLTFWAVAPIPFVLAVFVATRHIRRRMTKITISSDRLHYETGMFSKATRTVELVKVQDVRVSQTVMQRVFNIGDVSLETAGGSSRIIMDSIDRPQEVSNHIMDMARAAGKMGDFSRPA